MMKKIMVVACVMSIFLVSCGNLLNKSEEKLEISENYDINVVNFLRNSEVKLVSGVSISDLGLTLESVENRISRKLSQKLGRNVENEVIFSVDDIVSGIENSVETLNFPNFIDPTENDIEKIMEDFPSLTNDDVMNNIDLISAIYQDEIGVLVFNEILEKTSKETSDIYSRSIGYSSDSGITIYELAAMLKHPLSALTLLKQRQKTFDITEQYMGTPKSVDGKIDAFRHAMLSIVMAKYGVGSRDAKIAWSRDMTTAHEKGKKYTGKASEMDLHNNDVGLRYYSANSAQQYKKFLWFKIKTSVSEPSYDGAAVAIREKTKIAKFVDKNLSLDFVKNNISSTSKDVLVYIDND